MKRKIVIYILLSIIIFLIVVVTRAYHNLSGTNPIGGKWIIHISKHLTKQGNETPVTALPKDVVIDPETAQYVLFNELTILASGENVEALVAEFNGEIVLHVKETDTYQVQFPVEDFEELKQIRIDLESRGLTVYFSTVIIP